MERLQLLAEIERRRLYRRDGHLSAHAWLAARFGDSAGSARADVRVASALTEMPAVSAAAGSADLAPSAVRMLVAARSEHPEAFAQDEAHLVRDSMERPADQVRQRLAEWSLAVDERSGWIGPSDSANAVTSPSRRLWRG